MWETSFYNSIDLLTSIVYFFPKCSYIILKEKEIKWGPKPFCMFNFWRELPGFSEFVRNQWRDMVVEGWAGFVLKEILKILKQRLKVWVKEHGKNRDQQIKEAKEELL